MASLLPVAHAEAGAADLGRFVGQTDIGDPKHPGTLTFDAAKSSYAFSGGLNRWFKQDSFHFVWKKMAGDIALAADIGFVGAGGETTMLTKLFGGPGTINAPSWSPDSSKIAYVRYQPAR